MRGVWVVHPLQRHSHAVVFPDLVQNNGEKLAIVGDGLCLVFFVLDWFLLIGFPKFVQDDGKKRVWDGRIQISKRRLRQTNLDTENMVRAT